jgi:hypothetical protein
MPLTEPLVETNSSGVTVLTQSFERARHEPLASCEELLRLAAVIA